MTDAAARRARPSHWIRAPRRRQLFWVGCAVVLLVVVNCLVRATGAPQSTGSYLRVPVLPVVQRTLSSAWRCPGPLPVGPGKGQSHVTVVNDKSSKAVVVVTISSEAGRSGLEIGAASISTQRYVVGGDSELVVPLRTTGVSGYAAVSVETNSGAIGVSESISGISEGGKSAWLSSACTLGSASRGYIPVASTSDSSDALVALYNPSATPAVVDIKVFEDAGVSVEPPAFQGVVIPPSGVVVLDLRRWVFQVNSLAISATALSGDIVVGALETTYARTPVVSERAGKRHVSSVYLVGRSLLVGPSSGLSKWEFASRQSQTGVTSMYWVYNTSSKPVLVRVTPSGASGSSEAFSEEVAARSVIGLVTPEATAGSSQLASVVVQASKGSGIVVARVTTSPESLYVEQVNASMGAAGPSVGWVVLGGASSSQLDDTLILSNPGAGAAIVKIRELTGAGAAIELKVVTLAAYTQWGVDLRGPLADTPAFALEVTSSAPVLVEQQLRIRGGLTTVAGAIPVRG